MNEIENLVQRAVKGDNNAFDELYNLTSKSVYFICLSFLKNESDAADIMQETYFAAFKSLGSLKETDKFEPWIKKIAVNRCKNLLKKKTPEPLEDEVLETLTSADGEIFLPEDYITNQEKRHIIIEIMQRKLSEVLYQTVILHYFNEMTVSEIAEIMDCPEGTVTYRLSAARAKIKDEILKYEEQNNDKLHGIAIIAILPKVLHAEAESLEIPNIFLNITSGSASQTGASSVTKTASKSILKTAKAKIIAGAAAVAVIGAGGGAALAVHNHNGSDSAVTDTPSVTESSSNGDESSSNQGGEALSYWVESLNPTGEIYDSFDGNMFAESITLPIDLTELPYSVGDYNSFSEALSDESLISKPESYYVSIDNLNLKLKSDGIYGDLKFCNFGENELTLKQVYENNWWYIYCNSDYNDINKIFFLSTDAEYDDYCSYDLNVLPNEEFLNGLIDKFGQPTSISTSISTKYDDSDSDGSESTYYDLVYEYTDCVVIITFMEIINESDPSFHVVQIASVSYYTRECFEEYKKLYPDFPEEN